LNPPASQSQFNGHSRSSVVSLAQTLRSPILLDCLVIAAISLFVHSLLTSHYVDGDWLVRDDTTWYLNRAHLLWRGVFDDAFVYTVTFPVLVGAVNLLIHDLVMASMIVNALALYSALVGTYLLGRVFYTRQIAWIGVLVLVTIWNFTLYEAVQQPFMLFNAAVVWCVLTCWLMARYPSNLTAALFGLSVAFALYTRLEGGLYFILLIPAIWFIYRSTHDWRQVLRVSLISGVIFGIAAIFYVAVILKNSEPGEGAGAFAIMNILNSIPVPLDVLSRRYTDTIFSGIVYWWPLWVWGLVLAGLIWDYSRYRTINRALALFLVFNLAYAFVLSNWPLHRYIRHYLPFFALLIGAIVWQPRFISRWRGRVVILLLLAAICLPGIWQVVRHLNRPGVNYRESEYALSAIEVDRWLEERGWQNTEIFTLCGQLLPFTHGNFHLIYRLGLRNLAGNSSWWDSPHNLLTHIREHDLLFMSCSSDSVYKDWDTFLEDPSDYSERLQEVGRIGDYVFYRVVAAEAVP
jgi:hypothetical protein